MLKILILSLIFVNFAICTAESSYLDSDPLFDFKIESIHKLIKSNKWSCVDVISYFLERSATYDPNVHAIISYNPNAIKRATQLDQQYRNNPNNISSLHCIPVIVKDNIDIAGIPTTAGIRPFRNQVPEKNAMVIDRLLKEGAVLISKANMAQLAIGALYQSDQVGLCLNPFDPRRTCSGSSSGSAAGISAGFGVVSLGSDTGGSIIGPASFNGVFGLRPPVDSNLIDGVLPVNLRKDSVGPFAKHIDDLIHTYSVLTDNSNLRIELAKTIDAKTLKVLIFKDFFDSFQHESANYKYDYFVDPILKPLINDSLTRIKNSGIQIVERYLTQTEKDSLTRLSKAVDESTLQCTIACLPKSYQDYWADAQRFGQDKPFSSFRNLMASPLLDIYWKTAFDAANLNLDMDLSVLCNGGCLTFDELNRQFLSFFNELVPADIDGLFLPSITSKVKLHSEAQLAGKDDNFGNLAIASGNGFLIMPSGFTPANQNEPDGLPFAMALVFRSNRQVNAFKVAKLYEMKQSFAKLPSSVPLLSKKYQQDKNVFTVVWNFFTSLFNFFRF
ncbi:unnamed protein product [Brachionus calyciflorus]|uniref:Amidase domain-containing protein n=1 Tax=Brachionus calyciflorus TaxID=104777 RepID=A0A813ZD19_9BILA|nr:unnamed protein product [Brachionus calyciflorus]